MKGERLLGTQGRYRNQTAGSQHPVELTQRGRLVEEVKRRGRHDRVQRVILERQMFGRPVAPLHLRRARPGLAWYAVEHVDTVDLVGVQLFRHPVRENLCAAGDVGHPAREAGLKRSDNPILRRAIHPLLKKRQVV
jgi:hypothetical protein